jgi:hypothetical protein
MSDTFWVRKIRIACLVAITGGCIGALASGCSTPVSHVGMPNGSTTVPVAAQHTVNRLGARSTAVERSALSAPTSRVISFERIFPVGTRITLTKGTWQSSPPFAHAMASISEPGRVAMTYEFGFIETSSGWQITFAEAS